MSHLLYYVPVMVIIKIRNKNNWAYNNNIFTLRVAVKEILSTARIPERARYVASRVAIT